MEIEADLSRYKYVFAIPAYDGKVNLETMRSMIETTNRLSAMGVKWGMLSLKGCALADAARNDLAHQFLTQTDGDVLVFIDSDMSWEWSSMERLLVWATVYPVVSGVYCGRMEPPTFMVNVKPGGFNEHGLLSHEGCGLGFTAIHRKVFEKIEVPEYTNKKYPEKMQQFFATGVFDGRYIGEDIYFFRQCLKAGFQPMADPGIELIHHGTKDYNYQFKDTF